MLLILYSDLEIRAQLWSEMIYSICLRRLFISSATASELLSNKRIWLRYQIIFKDFALHPDVN